MISAVALLHQYQRLPDPHDGDIVRATPDDYAVARRLLSGPLSRSMTNALPDAVRRFGDRLRSRFGETIFDTAAAAKGESIIGDRRTVRAYLRDLARAGVLAVAEPGKGPKPTNYRFAAADEAAVEEVLPAVEAVCGAEKK